MTAPPQTPRQQQQSAKHCVEVGSELKQSNAMPAHKRTSEANEDDHLQNENLEVQDQNKNGSDRGSSSSEEDDDADMDDNDEFIEINLADIRKDVQCPICLGIIRKTRTMMECLHRFCKECIDKSMRLGNNECPACRTHCASRRSLRDDPNFDALIAAIYPDIDKYEDQEMTLLEEEKARNKQLQDSIAQTLRRQIKAQGKKRAPAKATSTTSSRISEGLQSARTNRMQNYLDDETQGSAENEDENCNDGGRTPLSSDEECTEGKLKRSRARVGVQFSEPSAAGASASTGRNGDDCEVTRDYMGLSPALSIGTKRLSWGNSGLRSRGSCGKSSRMSSGTLDS